MESVKGFLKTRFDVISKLSLPKFLRESSTKPNPSPEIPNS